MLTPGGRSSSGAVRGGPVPTLARSPVQPFSDPPGPGLHQIPGPVVWNSFRAGGGSGPVNQERRSGCIHSRGQHSFTRHRPRAWPSTLTGTALQESGPCGSCTERVMLRARGTGGLRARVCAHTHTHAHTVAVIPAQRHERVRL